MDVRLDGSPQEREGRKALGRNRDGSVPLALAAISGRTLGDVFRAIGGPPYARGDWWQHAAELGLKVERALPRDPQEQVTLRDLHDLPEGRYLVDTTFHLSAMVLGPGCGDVLFGDTGVWFERTEGIPPGARALLFREDDLREWREATGEWEAPPPLAVYTVSRR